MIAMDPWGNLAVIISNMFMITASRVELLLAHNSDFFNDHALWSDVELYLNSGSRL